MEIDEKYQDNNTYKHVINCLPDGVAIINANADIIYTNKSLNRILNANNENVAEILMNLENSFEVPE